MSPVRTVVAVMLLGSLLPSSPAMAGSSSTDEPSILMTEDLLMAGLANSRGDLYFRRAAQQSMADGRNDRAVRQLKRAAYFADKPAQALLAEFLWNGSHGQRRDRAEAYAWMDLAAERGYPELISQRETYWAALSPTEQQRALTVGHSLYARYGDEVARPRLARQLRRQTTRIVGSYTGFAAGVTILAPAPGSTSVSGSGEDGVVAIEGSRFYAPYYWIPEQYFRHQDRVWKVGVSEQRNGTTNVGPLQPVTR